MKFLPKAGYWILTILLAISFWSSGVMLIRFLATQNIWSQGPQLWLVYGLSIPIIFVSIRGVQNIFVRFFVQQYPEAIYQITGLVLMAHALALTCIPTLYFFTPGTSLYATAWLLWFGGITILLRSRNK